MNIKKINLNIFRKRSKKSSTLHYKNTILFRIVLIFVNSLVKMVRNDGFEYAGYMTFLMILSTFPFIFLLTTLAGFVTYVFGTTIINMSVIIDIIFSGLTDATSENLKPYISAIVNIPSINLINMVIAGALWTSSSLIEGIRTILNKIYRISEPPNYILRRILSIIQVIVLMFILTLSLIMLSAPTIIHGLQQVGSYKIFAIIGSRNYLLFSTAIFLLIWAMYYFIPSKKQGLINTLPGTIVAFISMNLSASLYSEYIKQTFANIELVYGGITSVIITTLFFYLISLSIIYGGEFNHYFSKLILLRVQNRKTN